MKPNERFAHMTDIELVIMRKQLKDANMPEDKEFYKELEQELKFRALLRDRR